MLRAMRARIPAAGGPALLALLCAGLLTRCSDPQSPGSGDAPGFAARWDNGTLEFRLDDSRGGSTDLALVATQLQFDTANEVLTAGVAVRNRGDHAATGPMSVVVYGFIPGAVSLLNGACGAPLSDGECAIDYRGAYGAGGTLAPGETSAPVTWTLHVPGGQSFAFRARLGDAGGTAGVISGVLFADTDRDGRRDSTETGVAGIKVRLRGPTGSSDVRTDAHGSYRFEVSVPGIYEVAADPSGGLHATTPQPLRVTILRQVDGSLGAFTHGDIGVSGAPAGPTLLAEGFAYTDLDRDGQMDAGEPGIAGVKIRGRACERAGKLAGDDDGEIETRTGADGYYQLLLPDCGGGPWEIRASSVEDTDRTSPKEIVFTARPVEGGSLHADFGYAAEAPSSRYQIRGVVFRDDDGDGLRGPLEPALPGVLVTADGVGCAAPVFASDRTDERGRYKLEGHDIACPLPWQVQRASIPGMQDTTPASVQLGPAPPSGSEFIVDFGVRPLP